MTGDMYPTDGNQFAQPLLQLSKVDAKNYGFNWIKRKRTDSVCLHAQLHPIKDGKGAQIQPIMQFRAPLRTNTDCLY